MRAFGLSVVFAVVGLAGLLVVQSTAPNDVTGWVALVSVALAVAGLGGALSWWFMTTRAPSGDTPTPTVVRLSLALGALSAIAAAALVGQAAAGGAVWAWIAFAAVAAVGVCALVLWALHATN